MEMADIRARVEAAFAHAQVEVQGEGCNAEIRIISEAFDGQGRLARQRAVLGLFSAEIASGELHALTVKARTPAEGAVA